jgi:hypothetical protein
VESNWIRMKLGKTEAGTKTTDDISQSGRMQRNMSKDWMVEISVRLRSKECVFESFWRHSSIQQC